MATSSTRKPVAAKPKAAPLPARRRIRLTSCRGIRRELAALYTAARLGELPTSDASRLASVLDILRRTLEAGELETRIRALEAERAAPAGFTVKLRGRP